MPFKGEIRHMDNQGKLELKATLEVGNNFELYKVIDFLNRTLKDKNLIFGLSLKEKDRKMVISVYET